jgi:hypothetical protein
MCLAFLQLLEAPPELTVLEWCVEWLATVPEFQGSTGNNGVKLATTALQKKEITRGQAYRASMEGDDHNHAFSSQRLLH